MVIVDIINLKIGKVAVCNNVEIENNHPPKYIIQSGKKYPIDKANTVNSFSDIPVTTFIVPDNSDILIGEFEFAEE